MSTPSLYPKEAVVLQLLCKQHQFRDCTSAHNCFTCQDRHHTLLHRNSGPTTLPIPFDPPRSLSASVPHTISSYLAQVSVQKVPPKNTPFEYWVPYPALDSRRTRGIKSYQCRVCQKILPLRKCHARIAVRSPSPSLP